MPILRLRGKREALTINHEKYKEKIVEYLEARGYFVVASAETESIFADVIFKHQFESIENWLEIKATSVSLGDSYFIIQLAKYLSEYLKRTSQNRFNFWLASYKLVSDSFEKIFDNFEEDSIKELIQDMISKSDEDISNIIKKAKDKEIKQFFETSQIIEGDPRAIDISRAKIIPDPPEKPQFDDVKYASEIMNNYGDIEPLIEEHSGYVNLFPLILPKRINLATTPYSNYADIYNSNPQVRFPPFRLEHKRIFTFEDLENSILREYVNIQTIETKDLDNWLEEDKDNEFILIGILNRWIGNICRNERMRYNNRTHSYFYPKPRGRIRPLSKTWISPNGIKRPRVVTNPYKKNKILNFWTHRSVRIRTTNKWGKFHLIIRPRWLFSENGLDIFEGEKADKLDRLFRKNMYNRNKNALYDTLFWYDILFKHTTKETPNKLKTFLTLDKTPKIEVLNCLEFKLLRKPNSEIDIEEETDEIIDLKLEEFW